METAGDADREQTVAGLPRKGGRVYGGNDVQVSIPPDDGESTASATEWIGRGLLVLYSLDRDHRARALHSFERREIQSFVREHFSAQVAGQPGVRIGGAPGRRNLKNALSSKLGC